MSHGPSANWGKDNASSIKLKVGMWMFLLYTIVYAGFILINLINPKLMALDIGSQNLAIVYGFGLIIFALLLAVVYNHICTIAEEKLNKDEEVE